MNVTVPPLGNARNTVFVTGPTLFFRDSLVVSPKLWYVDQTATVWYCTVTKPYFVL